MVLCVTIRRRVHRRVTKFMYSMIHGDNDTVKLMTSFFLSTEAVVMVTNVTDALKKTRLHVTVTWLHVTRYTLHGYMSEFITLQSSLPSMSMIVFSRKF